MRDVNCERTNLFSVKRSLLASVSVGFRSKETSRNGILPARNWGESKIRKRGWGRGRKDPWILKTSVRQRTGLMIGSTSRILLTCVDHRIKNGKHVYKNFSSNEDF